jgi:cardiolipin synthase A/B
LNDLDMQKVEVIDKRSELLPLSWVPQYSGGPRNLESGNNRLIVAGPDWQLHKRIINTINSAKEIICVSSFLLADKEVIDALLNASSVGKRVYVLTASEVQLRNESKVDNEFDQDRLKDHLQIMQELAGRVLVRTGENFHSKFLIVDPNDENAKGFLFTANLTLEALVRNVELGVELTPFEARDLFRQFLIGFWRESSSELLDPGSISKVKTVNSFNLNNPSTVLCTAGQIQTIKKGLSDLISIAKNEIIVSTYGIQLQHEITQKLIAAAKSGKKVRVMARPRANKTTMEALVALLIAGAEVRGHPWLHAKSMIVDTAEGWSGLVMTANIEATGLDRGFETGISLQEGDAAFLHKIFENWWENFPYALFSNKTVGQVSGDLLIWQNEHLAKITVGDSYPENLGEIVAKSFEEMEQVKPDLTSRIAAKKDELFHEYVFSWSIVPPKLPVNAQRIRVEGDIGVYRQGNEFLVAIQHKDQLVAAQKIAANIHGKVVQCISQKID